MPQTPAPPQRRRLPWYARCVLYVVVIYLVYCGLLFFFQHKLIFPTSAAGVASPQPFHRDAEVLTVETEEGKTLGWFIPAPGSSEDNPAPLVVFLHGNAELIDHQPGIVQIYHAQGVSVLLPEYRGYGDCDGTPCQAHIVPDVVAFYDQAVARPDVDPDRVVIHGRSIGGAVAAQLADRRPCVALIVESTGTSVASQAWRYGAPPFLVRSPFHTKRVVESLDVPVLIMHGEHDRVFKYQHARDLLAAARHGTLVPFNAGHGMPGSDFARYEDAITHHLGVAGVVDVEDDSAE